MLTVAFENHFTLWYQIQEMIRAERMVDDDAIQFELDTYNALIPGPGELSVTLFIEIADTELLHEWLPKLPGIEQSMSFEVEGAGSAPGKGEEGRSKEAITSTVHYVCFKLTREQVDAIKSHSACRLRADHPEYQAEAAISPELLAALADDLGSEPV